MAIVLRPDPKPDLRRRDFAAAWGGLQRLKDPAIAELQRIEAVERHVLDAATDGDEPEAWCESCGAPFFDGDDYTTDGDGIASCRFDAAGARVGRCFADQMAG